MTLLRILLGRARRLGARHLVPIVAGTVLVVIELADLVTGAAQPLLIVAGGTAIAYGVYEVVHKVYLDASTLDRVYERFRVGGPLGATYERPYDDWDVIKYGQGSAVTDSALNVRLAFGEPIRITPDQSLWKPSGEGEALRRLLRVKLDADEQKIRLSSDLFADTSAVTLQRTVYSAFLVTNRLGTYELRARGSVRELIDGPSVVLRGGLLPRLSTSLCSNHIGVDVLGFTADGRILLTRQSGANQLSRQLIAPSGSGSVDWSDIEPGDDLRMLLARAMCREMREELGLDHAYVFDSRNTRLLGYARMSHLAGKPQFFGVARLPPVVPQVRSREKRYADDHLVITYDPQRGAAGVAAAISAFERQYGPEISIPLIVNLRLFGDWLSKDSEGALAWLHPQH